MDDVTVCELWEYFLKHKEKLENEFHLIASNEADGVEVYLTSEHGLPAFSVEVDGEEVYSIESHSKLDAEKIFDSILAQYIYPEVPETNSIVYSDYDDPDGFDDEFDPDEEILCAVDDLLRVILRADPKTEGVTRTDMQEIALLVEEYLFGNCNCPGGWKECE